MTAATFLQIPRISVLVWLLAAATALLPLYLGPSGGIQLAHALFAFATLTTLAAYGLRLTSPETFLLLWLVWVLLREAAAVAQGLPYQSLIAIAYVAFNLLLVIGVRVVVIRGGARFASYGLGGALLVAILGVIVLGAGVPDAAAGARAIGTFNNPNQLGYFAICCASIACLLYFADIVGRSYLIAALCASVFLVVTSLSKAAMVSLCVPVALVCLVMIKRRKYYLFGAGVSAAIAVGGLALLMAGLFDDLPAVQRLKLIGADSDDSLDSRGYTIVSAMGAGQLLFGLGTEGVKGVVGHEVHSTIVNNFAAYGFFGVLPFLLVLFEWARRVYSRWGAVALACVWLPPMLYGLTHNGSRFTAFWLIVALSLGLSRQLVVPSLLASARRS